jgi:hypothetical protein
MAAGLPATAAAPPPSVPLTFLASAGVGLTAFGVATAVVAGRAAVSPTAAPVVATAHLCMLGFLATAVLGALHQFGPVVGGRPLRSVGLARLTAGLWVPASAALPLGFATGNDALVSAAGVVALTALVLAAVNLSRPLATRGRGAPLLGLRLAVALLVATAAFGVVYAFDRQTGWFPLMPHRVLAHAHLGLLGALGLAYMAVAEKLWPMFLLSHPPGRSPGDIAVRLVPAGVVVLVPGLLFAVPWLAAVGAALAVAGLAAHLASLRAFLLHRRRRLELLHGFILAGAAALVMAVVLGALAGLAPVSTEWRSRLVTAEIVALAAWLGLAVIGHVHKIVPFIAYTALRARGVSRHRGGPLLFTHLYDARLARTALGGALTGFGGVLAGVLSGTPVLIAVGGAALAVTGVVTTANLCIGPLLIGRSGARPGTLGANLVEGHAT